MNGRKSLWLSFVGSLALLIGVSAQAGPIMFGPNSYGGYNAYQAVDTALTYAAAITAAQITFPGSGSVPPSGVIGHLASFNSEAEFLFLGTVRDSASGNIFIGLTDDPALTSSAFDAGNSSALPNQTNGLIAVAGTHRGAGWAFVDTNTLNTFHATTGDVSVWQPGEPNGGTGENAAELYSSHRLNDISQANTRVYMVEWDLNLATLPPPPPAIFNTRMIQDSISEINTTTEALAIASAATGLGPLTVGSESYNITVFVDKAYDQIDFAGGAGNFPVNNPYPNGVAGDPGEDFLVRATTIVGIPPGTWTIAFGSDDGGIIQMPGVTFESTFGENPTGGQGVGTDTILYDGPRGHTWTGGVFTIEEDDTICTLYGHLMVSDFLALFFERAGGDSFEIAIANGSFSSFTNTTDFHLLTDGESGWAVNTTGIALPEPASLLLLGGGLLALVRRRRKH